MEKPLLKSIRPLIPFLIFIMACGFLLAGLNPSFYADDSPETITAAATLGVPHPPGYPLLTLLGRLASLLPLGGIPFRVNLLSAFLAALVCSLLYLFLKKSLKVSTFIAAPVSLLWVVGGSLYPAALSAKGEVYELNALFLLGLFWTLREGRWALGVFLTGIFFTHHWMTLLVFLPGLFWMAYLGREEQGIEPLQQERSLFRGAAWFGMGASLWLALPLLSNRTPLLNWGTPWNFQNFLFVFLRREYGGAEANGTFSNWIAQGSYALKGQWVEFAGLSLAAFILAMPLLRKKEPLALGLFTGWACLFTSVCLYLHLSADRYFLIDSYELSSQLVVLVFLGWGLARALEQFSPPQRFRLTGAAVTLLALWLAGMGAFRVLKDRQTGYTYVYDFALNSFKCLPRGSFFFCRGDSLVFPSWYFQWVEKIRPDLAVAGVDGLPMEWIRRNLSLQHPALAVPFPRNPMGNESISYLFSYLMAKNGDFPKFLSYNQVDAKSQPAQGLLPYGLVYQYFGDQPLPPLDEARASRLWDGLRLRHLTDKSFSLDSRTRQWILNDYAADRDSLGIYYENRADDAAAKGSTSHKPADRLNIFQDYFKSYQQFAWSANVDPDDPIYDFNLGNALVHLGRNPDALDFYAKAVRLNPQYAEAYFNEAVANLNLGQGQKAGELFQKVLDLQPNHAEAKRGLEYVTQKGLYRP
jgi:hypothetical protein